jgi:hypothetical protein
MEMKNRLALLLFLIPQAARNILEILRYSRGMIWEDAPAAEQELFAQQEALLGELCNAVAPIANDGWDEAEDRLERLISKCEELRARKSEESGLETSAELREKLFQFMERAAANPKSKWKIDDVLKGIEEASKEGEG